MKFSAQGSCPDHTHSTLHSIFVYEQRQQRGHLTNSDDGMQDL